MRPLGLRTTWRRCNSTHQRSTTRPRVPVPPRRRPPRQSPPRDAARPAGHRGTGCGAWCRTGPGGGTLVVAHEGKGSDARPLRRTWAAGHTCGGTTHAAACPRTPIGAHPRCPARSPARSDRGFGRASGCARTGRSSSATGAGKAHPRPDLSADSATWSGVELFWRAACVCATAGAVQGLGRARSRTPLCNWQSGRAARATPHPTRRGRPLGASERQLPSSRARRWQARSARLAGQD